MKDIYESKYYAESIAYLQKDIRENCAAKGFDTPTRANIGSKLLLVVTEIAEAYEEARDGRFEVWAKNDFAGRHDNDWSIKPEGVGMEMADAMIRLLDIAEGLNMDMATLIARKMEYNATRPIRHGRATGL